MKCLQTYKLFEKVDVEITDYLQDIFLELQDKGLYMHIQDSTHLKYVSHLSVMISTIDMVYWSNKTAKPFDITDDVWASLEHIDGYLTDMGYKLDYISFDASDSDDISQKDSADDLDDLKRLIGVSGYNSFHSITLKYKEVK